MSKYFALILTIAAGIALRTHPAEAQTLRLSDEATISLITVLPGDAVYSMFGHSAFRVYDPVQNLDVLFNYGTFDFRDPLVFSLRFARGKLDYMLSVEDFPRAFAFYQDVEHRAVIEQHLALTAEEVEDVFDFLQINALPENRVYRYDFLFDNCSTRLRSVLQAVLGADVRFRPSPDPGLSFRRLLDPYVADRPFLDLGFDLLLGQTTDRQARPEEAAFLPVILMQHFDHAQVRSAGDWRPLVQRTDTLYWAEGAGGVQKALPWPAILFWTLFAAAVWLTLRRSNGTRALLIFDRALLAVVGLAGLLMLAMWTLTEHRVTADNWNLVWAWPTHLAAAFLIGRHLSTPARAQGLAAYLLAGAASSLLTVLAWPFWPQEFHPAVLPLALLLSLRCGARAYSLWKERPTKPERPPVLRT